jgi:hypothetical protein
MNNKDKLILSAWLVKQATSSGYTPPQKIPGAPQIRLNQADVNNLQSSFSNDLSKHFAPTSVSLPTKDPSQFFRSYMGSNFDPKSRVDRNKLRFLQSLQSEGMNLEDVKGNQADIYKRMKGMNFNSLD